MRVNYSKACYRLSLGSIIISFYHVLLAWKALHRTFCVDILMLIARKASLLILIIIETRVTSTHRQWFSVVCNSRQRSPSAQWSNCWGLTRLRLMSSQHFFHCADEYRCWQEYRLRYPLSVFLPQCRRENFRVIHIKCFAWHVEASGDFCTLIDNGKANNYCQLWQTFLSARNSRYLKQQSE